MKARRIARRTLQNFGLPEAAAQAESEAPMPTSIKFFEEATALKEQLVAWRRDIHQMPEIGLETPNTSAYIQSELTKLVRALSEPSERASRALCCEATSTVCR